MADLTDQIPDYLLIGHITHDVTPDGPRLGGTVSYAAHTAVAFGLRVAILTSAAPDEPLLADLPPQAQVLSIPAEHTTMFENLYDGWKRIQYMYHRAITLHPEHLPPAWTKARLVHLGPIAYEVDPAMMGAFGHSPICVTPQGWMRHRAPDGFITSIPWEDADRVLPRAALTVLSKEDIDHDPTLEQVFGQLAPLMVMTRAELGGTLYHRGIVRDFPAQPADLVDPTGAGDIFATTLHIALDRLGDLDRAILVATRIAALSVTRAGFASAPTPEEVEQAWALYAS